MSASSVIIIYDVISATLAGVLVPHDDVALASHLNDQNLLQPRQRLLTMPMWIYSQSTPDDLNAAVVVATGRLPTPPDPSPN